LAQQVELRKGAKSRWLALSLGCSIVQ